MYPEELKKIFTDAYEVLKLYPASVKTNARKRELILKNAQLKAREQFPQYFRSPADTLYDIPDTLHIRGSYVPEEEVKCKKKS